MCVCLIQQNDTIMTIFLVVLFLFSLLDPTIEYYNSNFNFKVEVT